MESVIVAKKKGGGLGGGGGREGNCRMGGEKGESFRGGRGGAFLWKEKKGRQEKIESFLNGQAAVRTDFPEKKRELFQKEAKRTIERRQHYSLGGITPLHQGIKKKRKEE